MLRIKLFNTICSTLKIKIINFGMKQEQLDEEDLCQFFNHLFRITTNTTTSSSKTIFVKQSYIKKRIKDQFFLHWSQLSHLNEYGRRTTIQLI
jgi:hypothetical protein